MGKMVNKILNVLEVMIVKTARWRCPLNMGLEKSEMLFLKVWLVIHME